MKTRFVKPSQLAYSAAGASLFFGSYDRTGTARSKGLLPAWRRPWEAFMTGAENLAGLGCMPGSFNLHG